MPMAEISIETVIITLGYIGIFGMMISNGIIGFPSSQILYIVAGFFVFTGDLNLTLVVSFGAIANTIGNIILYELSRRRGLLYITQFKIFPKKEIRKVQAVFTRHGGWFVFVGKLLPAIKVFIPIVAGIGKMNRGLYAFVILFSSILWSLIFLALGYYFGKNIDFFGNYIFILLAIALIVVGIFYRYMNSGKILTEVENGDEERSI